MNWLAILIQLAPDIPAIIVALRSILAKHPALQDPTARASFFVALGDAAANADDEALSTILADQKAHALIAAQAAKPNPTQAVG